MKVLFDHQIFSQQLYGGISRYFNELIEQFGSKDIKFKLGLTFSNNNYITHNKYVSVKRFFPNKQFKGKNRIIFNLNKKKSISLLKKNDFDVFHPTFYDQYFLDYLNGKPYVLTVHDLIHERFPQYFEADQYEVKRKKLLIEKATRIIAISENTKKDIIELYNIDEAKIDIVYHATKMNPKNVNLKVDLPEKYILFVGTRSIYKNFDSFILGAKELLTVVKELKVICAGGGNFTSSELEMFKANNISDKVIFMSVDDNLLTQLYKNALFFVFPSLYEGFGIPIIEAFACGCPVVLSNTSCFPEIAESAGLYFDPYNIDSIKFTLESIYYNEELRKDLINKGFNQLKKFTWEKSAEQTIEVYKKAMRG